MPWPFSDLSRRRTATAKRPPAIPARFVRLMTTCPAVVEHQPKCCPFDDINPELCRCPMPSVHTAEDAAQTPTPSRDIAAVIAVKPVRLDFQASQRLKLSS